MLQSGCCYKLCLRALHALAFPFPFPFPCFSLRSFTHSSKSALAFPFTFPFPGSSPRSPTDSSSFSPTSLASSSWASSSSSSSSSVLPPASASPTPPCALRRFLAMLAPTSFHADSPGPNVVWW